ncbi:SagB family peptide dehydrogenase [Bacillus sp. FJAT-29937]|uniref:SagB family peptide dehydrogenase n=1 Tax=Bacillus sp. FJAT-29937 TaxID=1720553 RepID=UPI00083539E8|nr:SagB family peptide dehydrogenase [Bacillus sp. FJAT-29937]
MSLETFLHNLHFNIEKIIPPDWEADWADAPLAYKLYRDLPVVELSLEVPLTLEGRGIPERLDLHTIGHFLWFVNGLTQFTQSVSPLESTENTAKLMHSYRRFIPSGGGLYPNELYMYLKLEDLPVGVYHYDVAHHRLVLLREGNFDSYLAKALGDGCDVATCFGTVFVSTMYWKNFFKYHSFSYRLQGLDAGVLLGQLLEVSNRFGFASGVYYQFLDRALNHLLGLPEQEESVYAVIPLSIEPTNWTLNLGEKDGVITAEELCREMPEIYPHHFQRSKRLADYSMLTRINELSMMEIAQSFRKIESRNYVDRNGQEVPLPQVERLSYDLAAICKKRYSPDMDFILGKVSPLQLGNLLKEAAASFSYRNDLDEIHVRNKPRVSLYGCFYNVEGIPDGAYYYDSNQHILRSINPGDHRFRLQSGLTGPNINLFQVPLCLHVVGDKDHLIEAIGYRGYRIQQMEAGMLVQRLLIAALANGMGGHPLLGFDANACDEIYQLDSIGKTSLIQIPIGPYRDRAWLKGSLQS